MAYAWPLWPHGMEMDMTDAMYTERKNVKLNLRLPARLDQEIRQLAEMDCISINSAIVRLLARGVREERASVQ